MAIKGILPARLPNGEEQFAGNNGNSSCKFSLEDDCDDNCVVDDDDDEAEAEAEAAGSEAQSSMVRSLYWESQEALLQEILENYKLSGTKVREGIYKIIERVTTTTNNYCECPLPRLESCAKCLRLRAVNELRNKGFTATLCTSKWNQTDKKLGGRHEYIEVIVSTQGRKKQVPLVIELNLRDEFKMGKSCEEYCRMVEQLPQMYIGKGEYLNAIVRAVCDAAKKSASEQRIHIGPWRKTSFMLMKWSPAAASPVEKTTSVAGAHQSSSTQLVIMSPRQWHASITSGLQSVTGTTVKVA
ncbi:PREDICTED: uncharacterized protein LOC109148547 isoform X2 [Ipomoea nil]|uniref:uncharacterized protein LOC109148547 isoform X2 n=1 Tax=Ipomoea nil TaxID=35883 RepID=UPI0009016CFB|nr:PREDICTED: uncharacterized protein LOC109148547 isoform X2 [Ipomoea nil]